MARSIVAQFFKPGYKKGLQLFSLVTVEDGEIEGRHHYDTRTYDVEWSRKYGYIFDQSGAGGGNKVTVDGIYYATGNVEVKERPNRLVNFKARRRNTTRRLHRLPTSFRGNGDLLDWLRSNGIEQDAVYCSKCRDWMPSDQLCSHCWFCDKVHWYSTPGDPCGCNEEEAKEFHCW